MEGSEHSLFLKWVMTKGWARLVSQFVVNTVTTLLNLRGLSVSRGGVHCIQKHDSLCSDTGLAAFPEIANWIQ